MGRTRSGGAPSFRFTQTEVAEMETILQVHENALPSSEVLEALAEKFSESEDRKGKSSVQVRQVWHWFQNKRYAIRVKNSKSPMTQDKSSLAKNVPQPISAPTPAPAPISVPRPAPPAAAVHASASVFTAVPTPAPPPSAPTTEFEAKSARDGAWYDVGLFLARRHLETSNPEVLVQFSGFGEEEAEWVNLCNNIRMRSLPCISSECSAVLAGDLVLCFQEVKEQALYFDAHVLDAQRRRHDARGCRCRFLVCYDHDQTEEIVELEKICRRPETNYRLQRSNMDPPIGSASKVSGNPASAVQNQEHRDADVAAPGMQFNILGVADSRSLER